MHKAMLLFGSAVMLALGASAHAQDDQESVEFVVGESNFSMPVPQGYCVPEGDRAQASAYFASLDPMNYTPAKVENCEQPDDQYTLVKALKATWGRTVKREPFLEEMDAALRTLDFDAVVGATSDAVQEQVESDGLPKMTISTENRPFGYIGRDEICVYIGGMVDVSVAGQQKRANAATCATVIAGKHMAINVYDFRENKDAVEQLTALARRTAESITPVP